MMHIITYKLTEQETVDIKKRYFDLIGHRSIISELVSTNPGMAITDTQVYEDYKRFMEEYDKVVNDTIALKSNGVFNVGSRWKVDFDKRELNIFTEVVEDSNEEN